MAYKLKCAVSNVLLIIRWVFTLGLNICVAVLLISVIVITGCTSSTSGQNTINTSTEHMPSQESTKLPIQNNLSSYWHISCKSNPYPKFVDLTDVNRIMSVWPPTFKNNENMIQDRAFLNIQGPDYRVPVYAPADSDLIQGVYKSAKGALDYDLKFQVSCEYWYFINHITEPVDKIRNALPNTPVNNTRDTTNINPPMHFKAGELLGYTTGTPLAHNWDFAVFDLNHHNNLNLSSEQDQREENFICPFDVLDNGLKRDYYSRFYPQRSNNTICTTY